MTIRHTMILSITALRKSFRSRQTSSLARQSKRFLRETLPDVLEERQLLAGSIVTYNVAPYPGASSTIAAASTEVSPGDQPKSGRKTTLADLDPLAQYSISTSIGSDQSAYYATATPGGFALSHDYSVSLTSAGAAFQTGSDTWQFTPVSYGYGASQLPIDQATPKAEKNRVIYDTHGIDTWFVNGPMGVQQGFTVADRPEVGTASDPLTVTVGLGGTLSAAIQPGGDGLNLLRPNGSKAMTFAGLTAFDATGRVLDAHFELASATGGQQLQFVVNDTQA
ncbi:MAG: hypothetical protein ACKO0V_01105, partial [bacterium]